MLMALYGAGKLGRYIGGLLPARPVFVDDTPEKHGTTIDGASVMSLPQFSATYGDSARLYSCIFQDSSLYNYSRRRDEIRRDYGISLLPFPPLLLELGGEFHFYEPREKLRKKMPRYQRLLDSLADEESVRALHGHLSLRETGDLNALVVTSRNEVEFLFKRLPDDINYVDVGAFDGDTIAIFLSCCGGKFGKIWAVEPDEKNMSRLRSRFAGNLSKRLVLIQKAVAGQRKERRFQSLGNMTSSFVETGGNAVQTVLLEEIGAPPPLFYKLDIEGEDLAVVRSSLGLIAKHLPFLEIAAYHYPDDLLEMVESIGGLDAGYRFYLRCFDRSGFDLTLFCIPPQ